MHQSFTDTLEKWFFDNFPMFPIVIVFFLFTALPVDQDWCRLSVQVPHITRWFPVTVRPSCFFSSDQNVQNFAVDGT